MPKIKTHRGAAKRFTLKPNGDFTFRHANRAHLNTKMTMKRKRHLRAKGLVDGIENKRIKYSIQ